MINIDTLHHVLSEQKFNITAIIPDNHGRYTVYCGNHKGMTQGTITKRISKINRTYNIRLLSTGFGVDKRGHYLVVREWEGIRE